MKTLKYAGRMFYLTDEQMKRFDALNGDRVFKIEELIAEGEHLPAVEQAMHALANLSLCLALDERSSIRRYYGESKPRKRAKK
jgi:hypothetical protein